MVSTLFSQTPPARDTFYQQVHFLRREIAYTDNGVVLTVGTIPAGSLILKALSGVQVNTAFNAGTTNVLDIGSTADGDLYATDLALGTVAFVALDEAVSMLVDAETTITVTVGLTGTAASAGSGVVVVAYIPKNPPSGQPL